MHTHTTSEVVLFLTKPLLQDDEEGSLASAWRTVEGEYSKRLQVQQARDDFGSIMRKTWSVLILLSTMVSIGIAVYYLGNETLP